MCIGIGISGVVDAEEGVVRYAPQMGWHNLHLAEVLSEDYHVPVYVSNSTELVAMAQFVYGPTDHVGSFATVRVGGGIGVGMVVNGTPYRGGGEIGHLRVAEQSLVATTPEREGLLETFLGWNSVKQRAYALREAFGGGLLPAEDGPALSYLHIRHARIKGDAAAQALQSELSGYLAQVFAWMIGLLRPDHIALAGPIADLGQEFLDQTVTRTSQLILPELVQRVSFSLAESSNWVALGAIAQALQLELGLV